MKINIKSKKIKITKNIELHINKKLEKINLQHKNIKCININIYMDNSILKRIDSEITILKKNEKIFATYSSINIYTLIDKIAEKISKQITKYEDKLNNNSVN